MKDCRKCKTSIHEDAVICPVCKASQRGFFARHWILSIILGIIALSFISGIFSFINNVVNPSNNANLADMKQEAQDDVIYSCNNSLLSRLKSPSTAKINTLPAIFDSVSGSKVLFNYVESQNSFGALLKSQYICVYTKEESTIVMADGNKEEQKTYYQILSKFK